MADILGQIDAALDEHDKVKSSIEKNTQRFDPLGGSAWDDDRVIRWGDAMRVRLVSSTGIEEVAVEPEAVVEVPGLSPAMAAALARQPRCRACNVWVDEGYVCERCASALPPGVMTEEQFIQLLPDIPPAPLTRPPFSLPPEDYEALYGAPYMVTTLDERRVFARLYLNSRVGSPTRLCATCSAAPVAVGFRICRPCLRARGEANRASTPAPPVDAVVEPDMSECRNVPNIPTRSWWSRLLPSRRTR